MEHPWKYLDFRVLVSRFWPTVLLTYTESEYVLCITSPSISQGNKDQRELELGERMSNEAVDINAEEYKKVNASSLIRS